MKGQFKWWVGGGILLIAAIAASSLKMGDSLVYFYTPPEAVAKAAELTDKTIKIGGMVKVGTMHNDTVAHKVSFILSDLGPTDIPVTYEGIPPDMFRENQGVVVEGRFEPATKSFLAKSLLVKHSEEYKKPDGTHPMDKEMLQKSLFK